VRWLPYQLNPDVPAEGMSRQAYIESKFGPGGRRNYTRVEDINAHRLMYFGTRAGREDETAEALFRAYFIDGKVLTNLDVLADIGAEAGLDRDALARYLASDDGRDAVLEADMSARRAGISGVPFFIFNRKVAISGAHEPETLLEAMAQAEGA